MAWLTIPALIGPLTGPPIGGFLTTYLSWHWIFWINVPIGIIGIIARRRSSCRTAEPRTPRPIDVPGFLLAAIAFSGIIFGLSVISLPAIPSSPAMPRSRSAPSPALIYSAARQRARIPAARPQAVPATAISAPPSSAASFFRIGIGAFPFLMPLMLQLSFGLTPFEIRPHHLRGGLRRHRHQVRGRDGSTPASASRAC